MSFSDYFINDFETAEDSIYPTLKTHYYVATLADTENEVIKLIDNEGGIIKDINDERHEIYYITRKYACIITLVSTHPNETAIDLKVETSMLIPALRGKKIIERLYTELGKTLRFKGVSLFRG